MGGEWNTEKGEGEIKEERHSQCVVIYSQLLSATLGGSMSPNRETETDINTPLNLKRLLFK